MTIRSTMNFAKPDLMPDIEIKIRSKNINLGMGARWA